MVFCLFVYGEGWEFRWVWDCGFLGSAVDLMLLSLHCRWYGLLFPLTVDGIGALYGVWHIYGRCC